MRVSRLDALVRADVAAQYQAFGRGELDGVFDGETWGEYVESCAYWENREGLTSEHVADRVADVTFSHGYGAWRCRRLIAQLTAEWFRVADDLDRTLGFPTLVAGVTL